PAISFRSAQAIRQHHGRFYRSAYQRVLQSLNHALVRWAQRKYKALTSSLARRSTRVGASRRPTGTRAFLYGSCDCSRLLDCRSRDEVSPVLRERRGGTPPPLLG